MQSKGTIILLGLERDIWDNTPASEKARYKQVGLSFFLLNLLTLVSGSFLMHLMGFSWILAIVFGAVSTFILMSIFRFSLIIYRRSIFDYDREREKLDIKLFSKPADATLKEKKGVIVREAVRNAKITVMAPIHSIKEYIRNGKEYSKIPGLGGFIRACILLMVAFLIILPLAAFIHRSYVEEINENRRNFYVNNYGKYEDSRLTRSVLEIEAEIEQVKARTHTGRENASASVLAQNEELIRGLKEKINQLNLRSESDKLRFAEKLTDRYFIVFTISSLRNKPGFYLSLITVLSLIIFPHWILYRLKTDPKSYYPEKTVLRYRSIIDDAYNKTEIEGYEFLEQAFGYKPGPFKRNIFWSNPPYCTVPRIHFSKKSSISRAEFVKMRGGQ